MTRKNLTLANQINNELQSASAPTQGMRSSADDLRQDLAHKVATINAEKGRTWGSQGPFDWKAQADKLASTHSFRMGGTQAYPVSKTAELPNLPGGAPAKARKSIAFDAPEAKSPVSLNGMFSKGKGNHRKPTMHSLVHSTIRAMELLGEHRGNNQKVIESLVNK